MITSTFLPAASPPVPPPLAVLVSPDVRPATTPGDHGDQRQRELQLRLLPGHLSPLPRLSRRRRSEKTFSRRRGRYPAGSSVSRKCCCNANSLTNRPRLGH